jgi:hypothetical protein
MAETASVFSTTGASQRLIPHDLVIGEHLLNCSTGQQPIQLPRRFG